MRPKKSNSLPKYVFAKQKTLQHPKGVLYFERRGWPSVKFQTQDATAPEFWVEYAAYMSDGYRPAEKKVSQKNFTALVDSYVRSTRYRNLAPATAHDYDKVLKFFKTSFGNLKPKDMKRTHVIQMRDSNSDRYRFANYLVQVGSVLFEHAIDLGWVEHNPAKGAGLLERNGPDRQPWPRNLIEAFREAADHRTLLMFELALSSGQRIQDVLDFRWSDLSDGGINLVQNKTGKSLWVPLSWQALTLLDRTKKEGLTIITTSKRYGHRPLAYRSAQQQIQSVREQIGAMDYDIHSLRYSAACELAEAGCTDEEIGAITGQTVQTVQHYTKSVRQRANALVAMKARERMLNQNTK
jgi:integrase